MVTPRREFLLERMVLLEYFHQFLLQRFKLLKRKGRLRIFADMPFPKEPYKRFHGTDDAKEIWEAIRTRFGGNANSKKMQKAVFKQQFEAFKISNSEGLEKGYDRKKFLPDFADEVIYSLVAKQTEDLDYFMKNWEQIDEVEIEEMDTIWQLSNECIRMQNL
ncbi:hypothetical protein Tco_1538725 [Tanacetum coccineum]